MSRVSRIAFGIFSALFALFLAGGFLIGSDWEVERTASIDAPVERIFPFVNRLTEWPAWTVWSEERYPGLHIVHDGSPEGVGAIQTWDDGQRVGILTITESLPGERIAYSLEMDDGAIRMDCDFGFQARDAGSDVRWTCRGESGPGLTARWMMYFFRPLIGNDFALGLERLRVLVEAPAAG